MEHQRQPGEEAWVFGLMSEEGVISIVLAAQRALMGDVPVGKDRLPIVIEVKWREVMAIGDFGANELLRVKLGEASENAIDRSASGLTIGQIDIVEFFGGIGISDQPEARGHAVFACLLGSAKRFYNDFWLKAANDIQVEISNNASPRTRFCSQEPPA